MATRTILVDDMDGGEADVTIAFVINDEPYTLDLSKANAARFWKSVNPFVEAAKKNATRRTTIVKSITDTAEQRQAIRAWAQKQGYDLAKRGRIPIDVLEAFNESHK